MYFTDKINEYVILLLASIIFICNPEIIRNVFRYDVSEWQNLVLDIFCSIFFVINCVLISKAYDGTRNRKITFFLLSALPGLAANMLLR